MQQDQSSKGRELALVVAQKANDAERSVLAQWAEALLQVRNSDLSTFEKARRSIQLTINAKTVLPLIKYAAVELKRIGWDERGIPARFVLSAVAVALTISGSGAGVAALGGAIGLPLWVVFGAGAAFAGVFVEEGKKIAKARSEKAKKADQNGR